MHTDIHGLKNYKKPGASAIGWHGPGLKTNGFLYCRVLHYMAIKHAIAISCVTIH